MAILSNFLSSANTIKTHTTHYLLQHTLHSIFFSLLTLLGLGFFVFSPFFLSRWGGVSGYFRRWTTGAGNICNNALSSSHNSQLHYCNTLASLYHTAAAGRDGGEGGAKDNTSTTPPNTIHNWALFFFVPSRFLSFFFVLLLRGWFVDKGASFF